MNRLQKQNMQLKEENNFLKYKIEVLLDMVSLLYYNFIKIKYYLPLFVAENSIFIKLMLHVFDYFWYFSKILKMLSAEIVCLYYLFLWTLLFIWWEGLTWEFCFNWNSEDTKELKLTLINVFITCMPLFL